jgi:hypothetical protein
MTHNLYEGPTFHWNGKFLRASKSIALADLAVRRGQLITPVIPTGSWGPFNLKIELIPELRANSAVAS